MSRFTLKGNRTESDIYIEKGCIKRTGEIISQHIKEKNVVIVSDTNVYPIYGRAVEKSLEEAGYRYTSEVVEAGEQSKCQETLFALYSGFYKAELTRNGCVVALGGGVVGDLAGFAAATYMRGVPVVQIPTSLLAQVDSSLGGKTAIDMPFGKNMIGAFHQPFAVITDPGVLSTLSKAYYADGMAEVIKYGCIKDKEILQKEMDIAEMIERCAGIKIDVVQKDEFDGGERMLLNFGHTIGHAIEKCENYIGSSHGEAVAVGMAKAAKMGEKLGYTGQGTADTLLSVLKKNGLPVDTSIPPDEILRAVTADKKRKSDEIQYVFLNEIGDSFIQSISFESLAKIYREVCL